jgi:large subunit ribosomal protein L9
MQVLLLKQVPGVGNPGETKKVNDGYARNYLFPQKLAVAATSGAMKQADTIKSAAARRDAKTLSEAQDLAKQLGQITLTFRAKAGEGDRLFGSITSGDIADALARDKHIMVDKRKIELELPLKELGERKIPIKLHPEVTAQIAVLVEREPA